MDSHPGVADSAESCPIRVVDETPWYFGPTSAEESQYIQVWCNSAYILVRKEDGLTEIGYKDGEDCQPLATDNELSDWLALFQWRAKQTFPWGC